MYFIKFFYYHYFSLLETRKLLELRFDPHREMFGWGYKLYKYDCGRLAHKKKKDPSLPVHQAFFYDQTQDINLLSLFLWCKEIFIRDFIWDDFLDYFFKITPMESLWFTRICKPIKFYWILQWTRQFLYFLAIFQVSSFLSLIIIVCYILRLVIIIHSDWLEVGFLKIFILRNFDNLRQLVRFVLNGLQKRLLFMSIEKWKANCKLHLMILLHY